MKIRISRLKVNAFWQKLHGFECIDNLYEHVNFDQLSLMDGNSVQFWSIRPGIN